MKWNTPSIPGQPSHGQQMAQPNPTGARGAWREQINRDAGNIANLDENQRGAEQNWINEYTGGVWKNPSVAKGRLGYDQRKEISLQNWYKDKLKQNQINNYNNFDVEKYVQGESDATRRNMGRNVMASQKQVRGNANASGMLFSGHRQMGEAQVGQQANQDFVKYQQELVKDALAKKQQLAADPLGGIANATSADLNRQMQMQQMQAGLQQGQSQLMGAGLGLIGTGAGAYYGGLKDPKDPTVNRADANNTAFNDMSRTRPNGSTGGHFGYTPV